MVLISSILEEIYYRVFLQEYLNKLFLDIKIDINKVNLIRSRFLLNKIKFINPQYLFNKVKLISPKQLPNKVKLISPHYLFNKVKLISPKFILYKIKLINPQILLRILITSIVFTLAHDKNVFFIMLIPALSFSIIYEVFGLMFSIFSHIFYNTLIVFFTFKDL